MKYSIFSAVLFLGSAFCFAQAPTQTPELTEKELEAQIKQIFDERDKQLAKPQVIYYAPVIKPSGDRIAYVKRTVEYRLKGGGLLPFLSDPPQVTWISDLIELCERDLASGTEIVIARWELPKPILSDPDISYEVGTVFPYLDWTDKLYYDIHLSAYNKKAFPEGAYCRGSGICLSNGSLLRNGNSTARGIAVLLDVDPWSSRYPGSNKVVITCEKSRPTCPSL